MLGKTTPAPRPRRRRWILAGILLVAVIGLAVRAITIDPRPAKPYLEGRRPVVLAHQGASGHAPSNTMESFKKAVEMGADILELDVHTSKDGVVVVHHDATVDRLTNGSGHITGMTLAELRQFDFGYRFSPDGGATFPYRGKGVTIPTLEEVLKSFPDLRVNIEIKQSEPPMEQPLWDVITRAGAEDRVLIVSNMTAAAKRWQELTAGRSAAGASFGDMLGFMALYVPHLDWLWQPKVDAFQIPTAHKLGPVGLALDDERLINRAHKLNVAVHYWTINDEPTMRRLFGLGADGIMTDYPDVAAKVLKEMGLR